MDASAKAANRSASLSQHRLPATKSLSTASQLCPQSNPRSSRSFLNFLADGHLVNRNRGDNGWHDHSKTPAFKFEFIVHFYFCVRLQINLMGNLCVDLSRYLNCHPFR